MNQLLLAAVAGAPKIIVVPELSLSVNVVIPVAERLVTELPGSNPARRTEL